MFNVQTALPNLNLANATASSGAVRWTRRVAHSADGVRSNRVSSYVLPLDSYSAGLRTSLTNSEISDLCRFIVASAQPLVGRKS